MVVARLNPCSPCTLPSHLTNIILEQPQTIPPTSTKNDSVVLIIACRLSRDNLSTMGEQIGELLP